MKIVQLTAENIKRLVAVEITPDGNLVEITGKNGQGKTSILDAILWAVAGNKAIQSKPVRDGAESGYVRLDLGDYIVTKKFKLKADGEVTISLTVENRDGAKYGSPQELLNKFLGDLTFDPLAFSRMKPRDQVTALRALVPDYDFDDADTRAADIFAQRTDANRQIRDLKGRVDAIVIPEGEEVEKVSVESLVAQLQDAMDRNNRVTEARVKREALFREAQRHDEAAQSRREEIERLKGTVEAHEADADRMRKEANKIDIADLVDTDPIRRQIADADATNAKASRIEEKKRLQRDMAEKQKQSDAMTKQLADIAAASAKAVMDANLPIEGLSLTEELVLLNGQPFDQASDAEQLRASIAVAGAMNPTLRVIRVRDGSLLDHESMALLTKYAEDNDLQVWCEVVESDRETAILIEDGRVAGQMVQEVAE